MERELMEKNQRIQKFCSIDPYNRKNTPPPKKLLTHFVPMEAPRYSSAAPGPSW